MVTNNQRAVGTYWHWTAAAIKAVLQAQPFYGAVDILGNPFITGYEPLRDAAQQVIGIAYVGYKADLQALSKLVAESSVTTRFCRFIGSGWQLRQDEFSPGSTG